ncbi:universal stress protein [Shimia sp. R9_2]|uniref:universal stress protein n=1 Tax=Shimia sp. R9_2 TaxID=2821112 RepID=UPI001ADB1D97|nr:universal stress protein [Shimia sp. R9_2]MBO9398837.1 universal stress protein [Shimia sp. R9_2]
MTRTVLAAIDLTQPEDQKAVLTKARQIADLEGMRLSVVTVLPDFRMSVVGTFFSHEHTREMAEGSRVALHKFIEETVGRDAETKHVIRMGKTSEEILITAEELDAQVIVMGAHKPNLRDYLIGPNAAQIARHAPCSVYIVR